MSLFRKRNAKEQHDPVLVRQYVAQRKEIGDWLRTYGWIYRRGDGWMAPDGRRGFSLHGAGEYQMKHFSLLAIVRGRGTV